MGMNAQPAVDARPVVPPVHAAFGDTASLERAPESVAELEELRPRWHAVVWNDPVNLMNYVAYVFRSYFGYSERRANALMLRVHHEGQAVVATGSREAIEVDVRAMHGFGLQATMRRVEE